jgi:5-formyltetrahydrofolate cyclo-ligase
MSTELSIKKEKNAIRQRIRKIRQQIQEDEVQQAEENIARNLASQISYTTANKIASFVSFDGEISTRMINDMLVKEKSVCFLPKVRPLTPSGLWFMPYTGQEVFKNNHFGIPEVDDLRIRECVPLSTLNIILVPLVAFDNQGNRLGMGKGYYDASLSYLYDSDEIEDKHYTKPLFVGLAYEQQKVDEIPTAEHDIKLDMVLTQTRSYEF